MKFGHWFGLILLLIGLYGAWQVRQLLVVVLGAIILANALSGVVRGLQKNFKSLGRGRAVMATIALSLVLIVGFFGLLVPPVVAQINQLPQEVMEGIDRLGPWIAQFEERFSPRVWALLPDWQDMGAQLPELGNNILGEGWTIFSSTLGAMLNVLLLTALTLMLLVDPRPYRQGVLRMFPAFYRPRVDEILATCDRALQRWFEGIVVNMLTVTLLSFIGLLLLRIPLALSQALIAGLFTLIPTLGAGLSAIPPMAIALLDQPWKSLIVLLLYITIQQLESNLLARRLLTRPALKLPALTLLAQLFFAIAFGIPGLFLSLPLTIVGQIWFTEIVLKDILNIWKSDPLPPDFPPHPSVLE
ncbi:AI-2E family transporter [Spirulina major CS-329]|jgi:predicted PurR-regulated permease PerM|uniref:AI-2E family transporter n=1 Tax=Spirulina TaxID=1154 RepID=UPI00232C53D5|nr:AI-2E family transporter [Spirulina major]MDB9503306.1 AI-2E family transporter [Spirulina major CS-329]